MFPGLSPLPGSSTSEAARYCTRLRGYRSGLLLDLNVALFLSSCLPEGL